MALAPVFGAVVGVLLGLLGGGGSILAVPLLVYGLGFTLEEAVPVSLIVVGSAAAVGALPKLRAGQVQWRLAGVFAAAGAPGAFVGSALGGLLPEPALMVGFAAVMVLAGARMLTDTGGVGTACSVGGTGRVNWRRCFPRAVPSGFAVGVLTGLFGVGGGFLIIPALVLFLGVHMPVAVGTSLVVIVANSATGLAAHLGEAAVNWPVAAAFAGTAVAGSLLAGHVGTRLDTARLQRWFAYLVLAVALYVVVDTVALG